MSLADELLAAMNIEVHTHEHAVSDPDSYFIIDPDSREITNAGRGRITIMQYDHNSEIFTFEVPRYVEGHDMMLCNRVRVHFDNVDGETNEERQDVAEMYDLAVDEKDPNKVISTWCIRREATQLAGTLNFLVQYECIDENGESVYEWHTDIFTDVYVKAGRNFGEKAVIEYSNVLEQWYQKLFGTGDSVIADIATTAEEKLDAIKNEGVSQVEAVKLEGTAQIEAINTAGETNLSAIQAKGAETLATIPEDYTTVNNMAEEALRRKANVIEMTADGDTISVNDSADAYLLGLNLYGKTVQTSTNGYQLLDTNRLKSVSGGGVAITNNGDGSLTVSGSGFVTEPVSTTYFISHDDFVRLFKVGTLYLSSTRTRPYFSVNIVREGTGETLIQLSHATTSCEITQELLDDTEIYINVHMYCGAGEEIIPGTTKPMLYQDGDGSWEPFSGGVASPSPEWPQELMSVENPAVSVCGKNLISDRFNDWYVRTNYLMFGLNRSGSFLTMRLSDRDETVDVTGCYIGFTDDIDNPSNKYSWVLNSGSILQNNVRRDYRYALIYPNTEETFNKIFTRYNVLVELDNGTAEYEPYEPIQTLAINHTLPGIPVASGGNYTDSNGQQWICDEIDFERGVYVQRVKTRILDGSESWWANDYQLRQGYYVYGTLPGDVQKATYTTPVLSDKLTYMEWGVLSGVEGNKVFEVSDTIYVYLADQTIQTANDLKAYLSENPIEIQYVLAIPVETPLTEEELANFKMIRTHYHDTTVMNDHNARMAIKYATDTRMFFENHSIATDTQVENAVDAWLTKHFSDAEEVSF